MQQEILIAVSDLAGRMGVEKTVARKWLKKQGFEFVAARDPVSRQQVNALPVSKAREAIELRRELGFPVAADSGNEAGLREVRKIG